MGMRITPDRVYLIMRENNAVVGGPSMYAEIEQESFFQEYNMEGVSQEHNEIFLNFDTETMHKNLTTLGGTCQSLKMKLTKKNNTPLLSFEVHLSARKVVHDIPIETVPRRCWDEYSLPELPPVNISLYLTDIKRFKQLVEKYKQVSSAMVVTTRKEGSLSLKVESDEAILSAHFRDLRVPVFNTYEAPWSMDEDTALDTASVRVEVRRLQKFLCTEVLSPEKVVINVVNDSMLHCFLLTNELIIQFFLPKTARA